MIIKQISVFVENRPGTLAELLKTFADHKINIRAMSLADTADFGIMRLIANEPDKVEQILRGASYAVKTTPVLSIKVSDSPGGLAEQIEKMSLAGINIEYLYAFAANCSDKARVVLKVSDVQQAERLVGNDEPYDQMQEGDIPDFYW